MNQYIDQQIAATDPKFRADLQQLNRTKVQEGGRTHFSGVSVADLGYMQQKREQFWTRQDAKLDVYLSDPSLGKVCGLRQYQ